MVTDGFINVLQNRECAETYDIRYPETKIMDDKPMEIILSAHDTISQKHGDDNCTAILMKVE